MKYFVYKAKKILINDSTEKITRSQMMIIITRGDIILIKDYQHIFQHIKKI